MLTACRCMSVCMVCTRAGMDLCSSVDVLMSRVHAYRVCDNNSQNTDNII